MRIALATCAELPAHEHDDEPLFAALGALGVEALGVAWDDAGVDWSGFDACLIRTTWDYQERHAAFLDWATRVAEHTRLFNPPSVVRWNTHKSYLFELEARGAPIATTLLLERGSRPDVAAIVSQRGWHGAFLKPAIGATARGTLRVRADEDGLRAAARHAERLLESEDLLLQPYLRRVESEGELSAIFVDGRLTHAVRKRPVAGDYRVQDDFGASDQPARLSRDERALACSIMELVGGDLLYGRVDFLRQDDGRLVLNELELVEPSLFFRHEGRAAELLAEALVRRAAAR